MKINNQPTYLLKGKIIRLETYFILRNSYVVYMWVRFYIDKSDVPLITPFFKFMEVFTGDSNELEKLIDSELEWTFENTKDSEFAILNGLDEHFNYALITNIVYSKNYISNAHFDFKKIVHFKNGMVFNKDKKLIVNLENGQIILKNYELPFDTFSYSHGNFILCCKNEQTRSDEIILFRHCRSFYDQERFFKAYANKEQFHFQLELYKLYTQPRNSEQINYSFDDMVNDAFEGDSSNLWNID